MSNSNDLIKLDQPEFLQIVKNVYCKGASDLEFKLFIEQAKALNLNPVAGQISQISFGGVRQVIVRIDGFRAVAHRSGQFAGRLGAFWCGEDGAWRDVWLDKQPPVAAKVGILRKDCKEPFWGVCRFDSYAKRYQGKLSGNWATMPEVMIAKCAEAAALRAAFCLELGGIYEDAELDAVVDHNVSPAEVEETLKLTPEVKTWEPSVSNLKALQKYIEDKGIAFNMENKHIFVSIKQKLIGVPLENVEQIINDTLESFECLGSDVPPFKKTPQDDNASGAETTTTA